MDNKMPVTGLERYFKKDSLEISTGLSLLRQIKNLPAGEVCKYD